jgi:hypothetical protein
VTNLKFKSKLGNEKLKGNNRKYMLEMGLEDNLRASYDKRKYFCKNVSEKPGSGDKNQITEDEKY